jgi:hypothetical protein
MHGLPPPAPRPLLQTPELAGMGIIPSRDELETVSMLLSHNAVHCFHMNRIKMTWKKSKPTTADDSVISKFCCRERRSIEEFLYKAYIFLFSKVPQPVDKYSSFVSFLFHHFFFLNGSTSLVGPRLFSVS